MPLPHFYILLLLPSVSPPPPKLWDPFGSSTPIALPQQSLSGGYSQRRKRRRRRRRSREEKEKEKEGRSGAEEIYQKIIAIFCSRSAKMKSAKIWILVMHSAAFAAAFLSLPSLQPRGIQCSATILAGFSALPCDEMLNVLS